MFISNFPGHIRRRKLRDTVTSILLKIQELQNHILQQRKPTNTGPDQFVKNYNASEMKLKKFLSLWYHQEFKIRTWQTQPDFFKFCHRDSVPLTF